MKECNYCGATNVDTAKECHQCRRQILTKELISEAWGIPEEQARKLVEFSKQLNGVK